jgi:hypothetical protein
MLVPIMGFRSRFGRASIFLRVFLVVWTLSLSAEAEGGTSLSLKKVVLEGLTWKDCGVKIQCQPFAIPYFANNSEITINADSSESYPEGDSSDVPAEQQSDGNSNESIEIVRTGPGKSHYDMRLRFHSTILERINCHNC